MVNGEDRLARAAAAGAPCEVETFGFTEECDWRGLNAANDRGRVRMDVSYRGRRFCKLQVPLPGLHNAYNALAAVGLLYHAGVGREQIAMHLGRYAGARRRMTIKAQLGGVTVLDDYAHHPTEIQATLKAIREFFQPRHARLWGRAKELADVNVMLHCCGSVRALMPDLIDAGLDAINPVQISCAGMDATGLKRDFGARITFWGGGCDTHQVLTFGTPEQVRRHVREQVDILAPGGGFVFQQVHNILANVPPDNIIAMFDALRDEQ